MNKKIIYYFFILLLTLLSCKTKKHTTNKNTQNLIEKELKIFMRFVNTIADDKHMVKGNIYQVIKHKVDKSIYYSFHNDKVYRKDYIYSFDDIYYLRNYPKLKLTGHTITNKFLICLYNNVDLPNIKNVKKYQNSINT